MARLSQPGSSGWDARRKKNFKDKKKKDVSLKNKKIKDNKMKYVDLKNMNYRDRKKKEFNLKMKESKKNNDYLNNSNLKINSLKLLINTMEIL